MQRTPFKAALLFAAVSLITLTGCYGTIAKRTADFSAKAAPAIADTRSAYQLVQTTHARSRREDQIALYDKTGFTSVKLDSAFGSEKDRAARTAAFDALEKYVTALADTSGDKRLYDLDSPGKDAGSAVSGDAKDANTALQPKTKGTGIGIERPRITPEASPSDASAGGGSDAGAGTLGASAPPKTDSDSSSSSSTSSTSSTSSSGGDGLSTAIADLGKIVLERRRAKALPAILNAAKGPVQRICTLLEDEIGDSDTDGLRDVIRRDFKNIETKEDAAIRDHPDAYPYPAKHAAVDALYTLVQQQAAADETLARARKALEDLAKTHTALADTARDKRAPGFHALLAELESEARDLSRSEADVTKTPDAGKTSGGGK